MDSSLHALSPSSTVDSSDDGASDVEHVLAGRWDLLSDWRGIGGSSGDSGNLGRAMRAALDRDLDTDDSDDDVSFLFSDDDMAARESQEQSTPNWQRPRRRNAVLLLTDTSSDDTSDYTSDDTSDDEDKDEVSSPEAENLNLRSMEAMEQEDDNESDDDDDDEDGDDGDDDDDDDDENDSSYAQIPLMSATPSSAVDRVHVVWNDDYSTYTIRRAQSLSPPPNPILTTGLSTESAVASGTTDNTIFTSPDAQSVASLRNRVARPSSADTIGRTGPGMQVDSNDNNSSDDEETTMVASSTPGQQDTDLADVQSLSSSIVGNLTANSLVMPSSNNGTSDTRAAASASSPRMNISQGFSGVFQRNRSHHHNASPRLVQTLRRHRRFQPWSSNGLTSNTPHEWLLPITATTTSTAATSSSPARRAQSPSATTITTTPTSSDSELPSNETSSVTPSSSVPTTPLNFSLSKPSTSTEEGGGLFGIVLDGVAGNSGTTGRASAAATPLTRSPAGTNAATSSLERLATPGRGPLSSASSSSSRPQGLRRLSLQAIIEPHRHTWWHRHVPTTGLAMAIPLTRRNKTPREKHRQPCTFLQAGQEFRGTQNLMSPPYGPSATRTSRASMGNRAGQMEEWHVKVTISAVDYASGIVYGLMEAMDVPMSSSNVVTYWEGEIVDFKNNDLWTRKWGTQLRTDIDHWKRLEAFQGLDEGAIVRGAKTGKFRGNLRQRYIFMRWKEKHFVNVTEQTNGLTIAGFYYIALRRADGVVEGFYHDRQSTPFQRLSLRPYHEMLGQSSTKFEFA